MRRAVGNRAAVVIAAVAGVAQVGVGASAFLRAAFVLRPDRHVSP